jgi:hypothetical protein
MPLGSPMRLQAPLELRHTTSAPVGNSDPWERVLMKKKAILRSVSIKPTDHMSTCEYWKTCRYLWVPVGFGCILVIWWLKHTLFVL